ncbi:MAG: hypothetical protein R3Y15_01040 [Rikenellaceae bacterium]
MKKLLVLTFFLSLWAGIIFYIIKASSYHEQRRAEVVCTKVVVHVEDSASRSFLSAQIVLDLLSEHQLNPYGVERNKIDIHAIESYLREVMYVKDVDVYMNMLGQMHIDLAQRRPMARFIADGGYDFYLSDDNHILPISEDYVEYVPVVSGSIEFPFSADYVGELLLQTDNKGEKVEKKFAESDIFLSNLINFVRYIEKDKFWDTQIVQLNVSKEQPQGEPTIEIVPRIGSHTILLGGVEHYQTKMQKMRDCYEYGMDTTMWKHFAHLDIQYSGQIIGIEKTK